MEKCGSSRVLRTLKIEFVRTYDNGEHYARLRDEATQMPYLLTISGMADSPGVTWKSLKEAKGQRVRAYTSPGYFAHSVVLLNAPG